jgi:hypothetical protein
MSTRQNKGAKQKKLMEDDNPPTDISLTSLWELMLSIKADTQDTRDKLTSLEYKVNQIDAKSTLNQTAVANVNEELVILRRHIGSLDAKLSRNTSLNQRMQKEITDLKVHSMKHNVIFSFDKQADTGSEVSGEDCEGLIRHFVSSVMRVPGAEHLYIPVAHRIGRFVRGNKRSILAKFPIAQELDLVMKHTTRLANTKHYVQRQIPPELRERRQFALPTYLGKKSDSSNKARLHNDKLYLRGSLQTQFLPPALPQSALDDQQPDIGKSPEHITDCGHTFSGYCAPVTSLDDVSSAVNNVIASCPSAHVMFAFRYQDDSGTLRENFESDGDYGVGLEMLRHMREQNTVGYVTIGTRLSTPDSSNIGRKRYDHVFKLCYQAKDVVDE